MSLNYPSKEVSCDYIPKNPKMPAKPR
jgi:hypothetical protein